MKHHRRVTISSRIRTSIAARLAIAERARQAGEKARQDLVEALCPFKGAASEIFATPEQQMEFLRAQAGRV